MKPTLTIRNAVIYQGNNLNVLPTLPDNSVDSIVCDPPYELGFMGKTWDSSGIAYSVELWRECLRVLKPGGHLLAFGGTRTWHRLAVAIEDAGFEIRDNIAWLYGSGFPKSLNISKSIEAKITTGSGNKTAFKKLQGEQVERGNWGIAKQQQTHGQRATNYDETAGATRLGNLEATTPEAKQWDGWGTALKPAHEPIVVARKPLIGTVAENVLTHGVGGLNIDATRIDTEVRKNNINDFSNQHGNQFGNGAPIAKLRESEVTGRWPANIILDEYTAELLDQQSGISKSGKSGIRTSDGFNANAYGSGMGIKAGQANGEYGDSGGASRFFYVAKASKRDRNEGLDELPEIQTIGGGGTNAELDENGYLRTDSAGGKYGSIKAVKQNFHPTVKPTALMQYLIRLVTPENGLVLDPFAGSGSTGKAAILENKHFIGIELTPEYLPIIEGRLTHAYETLDSKQDE